MGKRLSMIGAPLILLSLYYWVFVYPLFAFASKIGLPLSVNTFLTSLSQNYDLSPFDLTPYVLFIICFPILGLIAYYKVPNAFTRRLMAIAMTLGGLCFFLFFPALFVDLIAFVFPLTGNALQYISAFVLSCSLSIAVLGVINARLLFVKSIHIKHQKITSNKTIVQLSDVHVGSRSSAFLTKIVNRVNNLEPDWVFITGDLVDLSSVGERELKPLASLKAPVYFVIGNHDRYVSLSRLLPILEALNFKILRNQHLVVDGINIVGIDDSENHKQVKNELENIHFDPKLYSILLYHRPTGFKDAVEKSIDLMLSGHTHKGQIFPFNYMVKGAFKRIAGSIKIGESLAHVSTGTSTWGPIMRIGSTNEITLIELEPKTQS